MTEVKVSAEREQRQLDTLDFFRQHRWCEFVAYVERGEALFECNKVMIQFICGEIGSGRVPPSDEIECIRFLVKHGAYVVENKADHILDYACACASKVVITYLLEQPHDRSDTELQYYTSCIRNPNLQHKTVLKIWKRLVKARVPSCNAYLDLLAAFLVKYTKWTNNRYTVQLKDCDAFVGHSYECLEFIYKHSAVIKPIPFCRLHTEIESARAMVWMASHKIEPVRYDPQYTIRTSDELAYLLACIAAQGFTPPEKYIAWRELLHNTLTRGNLKLAAYILTSHGDQLAELHSDAGLINLLFGYDRLSTEAKTFFSAHLASLLTKDAVDHWLSVHSPEQGLFYKDVATFLTPYSSNPK